MRGLGCGIRNDQLVDSMEEQVTGTVAKLGPGGGSFGPIGVAGRVCRGQQPLGRGLRRLLFTLAAARSVTDAWFRARKLPPDRASLASRRVSPAERCDGEVIG